ncbi:MAG TPA: zinc-binding dehydrogenase [Streptosporangiaceae bacterium]|jgi:NADPH:quinone reductase-like Zn-dependent oxidoreductase
MQAYVLTGFGGPEKLDLRELPDPVPGPGELRIRVGAAALNNTDVWTREGAYGSPGDPGGQAGWHREPLRFPRVQGEDIVGRVDRTGPGVPAHRVGERVMVDPMLYTGGERAMVDAGQLLGSERDGGFADYVTVPAENAHVIDSPLTDAELATFPGAYSTALRMLNRARLTAGETVVVTGASGGVGSALVQLAKARGAAVVAVVGAGKADRVTELGADATVPRDAPDLAAAVAAAGSAPIDVVADVVAGPMFGPLTDALRPLGRYVLAGAIAGPVVQADLRTLYLKQLTLVGSSVASHEEFAELVADIARGALRPLLAGTYPLRDLPRAQADFARKEFFGKLVVLPGAA